jgi:FkbM family methyltransferase
MMFTKLRITSAFLATHPLTRRNRLAGWGRFLRWQIKSRLRDEVIFDWVAGTRLAVRRGMTGATGNIYAGLHEFNDMAFTLHFLRPGDTFVDVGANVGTYTILASGATRARAIAFEPDAGTAVRLARNIELNGLSSLVDIHLAAAGERPGVVRFSIGRGPQNQVVAADSISARDIPVETLDDAVGDRAPLLMKIDVEGYEAHVLRGANRVLHDERLKAVLTESRSEHVIRILEDAGFHACAYDAFRHQVVAADDIAMSNALFLRDRDFVTQRVSSAQRILLLGQRV